MSRSRNMKKYKRDKLRRLIKSHFKSIDPSNVSRGLWIVKVPTYLAEQWEKAPSDMTVASLRVVKKPNQSTTVTLSSTPELTNVDPQTIVATEHVLEPKLPFANTTILYSTTDSKRSNIVLEGHSTETYIIQPVFNKQYKNMKRQQSGSPTKSQRIAERLNEQINNYRPMNNNSLSAVSKHKKPIRIRANLDTVTTTLFALFEKHQFYTMKDLILLTCQPVHYLKEILQNICIYDAKKHRWELKSEFCHYSDEEKKGLR